MMPAKLHSPAALSKGTSSKTRHIFPFLGLSGELRNRIYEYMAEDAPEIRVFEGRIILPPLACSCRQIRSEMEGKYQEEALANPRIPIQICCTNLDFEDMFRWLEKYDQRLEGHTEFVRALHIRLDLVSSDQLFSRRQGKQAQVISDYDITWQARDARHNLTWSCMQLSSAMYTASEDVQLKGLESTIPRPNPITNKRLRTDKGNGYLVFCSARTLHAHQFSNSSRHLHPSSKHFLCHLCAYFGHLLYLLWPSGGLSSFKPAGRMFHLLVRSAIRSSCARWNNPEQLPGFGGNLSCFDKSLINLHSTLRKWSLFGRLDSADLLAGLFSPWPAREFNSLIGSRFTYKYQPATPRQEKRAALEDHPDDSYLGRAPRNEWVFRISELEILDRLAARDKAEADQKKAITTTPSLPAVSETDDIAGALEQVVAMLGQMQLNDG